MKFIARSLLGFLILMGAAACGGPQPTHQAQPSLSTPASAGPTLDPEPTRRPGPIDITDIGWFEVQRVGDTAGNQNRTLLVGPLDGGVAARIPLGSQVPADRRDGLEAFAWIDPQADGLFGGRALVWGRNDDPTAIEAVSPADGSLELVARAPVATVHVATADARLVRVFFITVDEATNKPTGLWVVRQGEGAAPIRMSYTFLNESVGSRFGYRLVANDDGTLLGVQPSDGPITVIDVRNGEDVSFDPGGAVVGFADGQLVAHGPMSQETGQQPVFVMDPVTGDSREISSGAASAQVVTGSSGDLLALMHLDETNPLRFEIEAIHVASGEARVAYTHEAADVGPVLGQQGVAFLGADLPEDWVLLTDSFLPFVYQAGSSPEPFPEASLPMLLNLRTSELIRLGYFEDVVGPSD